MSYEQEIVKKLMEQRQAKLRKQYKQILKEAKEKGESPEDLGLDPEFDFVPDLEAGDEVEEEETLSDAELKDIVERELGEDAASKFDEIANMIGYDDLVPDEVEDEVDAGDMVDVLQAWKEFKEKGDISSYEQVAALLDVKQDGKEDDDMMIRPDYADLADEAPDFEEACKTRNREARRPRYYSRARRESSRPRRPMSRPRYQRSMTRESSRPRRPMSRSHYQRSMTHESSRPYRRPTPHHTSAMINESHVSPRRRTATRPTPNYDRSRAMREARRRSYERARRARRMEENRRKYIRKGNSHNPINESYLARRNRTHRSAKSRVFYPQRNHQSIKIKSQNPLSCVSLSRGFSSNN